MKDCLKSIVKYFYSFIAQALHEEYRFTVENPKYSKYSIGRYTYGEPKVWVDLDSKAPAQLKIGSFCSIADSTLILLGREHRPDWITTFPFNVIFTKFQHFSGHPATKGDVSIGNDVWIGMNVVILSGIKIGDGQLLELAAS